MARDKRHVILLQKPLKMNEEDAKGKNDVLSIKPDDHHKSRTQSADFFENKTRV